MEIWKDVEGYEGLYQVSNCGRVKSLNYNRTGEEKFLKISKPKNGYLRVTLFKDRKKKTFLVHSLVAQAFLDNPNNLPEVNHIDECKTNNCVSNLEWCDHQYNCNYGTRNQRVSENLTNGKLSKTVLQIDKKTNEVIREWPSVREVQRQLGYSKSNISDCCLGKRKSANHYKWKYKEAS